MTHIRRLKVFVSYSHADGNQVEGITRFLPSNLFNVFFDGERLHPGWQWEPVLLGTIRSADVFVLMLGADTMQRDYVNKEVDTFLESHDVSQRGMIPVLLDGCEALPSKLSGFQAIDLRGDDAQSRARSIAHAIHGAFFVPTSEIAQSDRGPSQPTDDSGVDNLRQLWEAGQVGASPEVLAQMTNLGVARTGIRCAHDGRCTTDAAVVCVGCSTGACDEPFHAYVRFCTLIPPGDLFSPGTKMFYWCARCGGPVCTQCLGIEDDYPCPPDQVLSFRFSCPVCSSDIQVVPALNADLERVSHECIRWAHAGGPPDTI